MASLISLYEIFRDFCQLVSIPARSLSFRLRNPMDIGMVSITDFISVDFSFLTISDTAVIIIMSVVLLVCSVFLFCIFKNENHRFNQTNDDLSYEKPSKSANFFYQAAIIIITSLIPPVLQTSINIFNGSSNESYIWLLTAITLLMGLIFDPILFALCISLPRKKIDEFDSKGSRAQDKRQIHIEQLKKNPSILKSLYSSYSQNWHYFKFYQLSLKIFRIIHYASISDPKKSLGACLFFICFDLALNIIFAVGSIIKKPYLNRKENICLCLSFVTQAICLVLQMILLFSCYENEDGQITISILQFITCLLVYYAYWIISTISSFKKVRLMIKIFQKQLEFTAKADSLEPTCSFEKSLILSEEYNKNSECINRIWMPFWVDILTNSRDFKATLHPDAMHFIHFEGSPPYLMNFKGTVGERFEENTRIMKFIGKNAYENEIKKQDSQNFQELMDRVLQYVPPIDVCYKGYMYKASFYPFPFTVLLQPDTGSENIIITDPVQLQELVDRNNRFDQDREVRQIVRCLNLEQVEHETTRSVSRTKSRINQETGEQESYSVEGTITYSIGQLKVNLAKKYMNTYNNWSQPLQLGRGFNVTLYYNTGKGMDSTGESFDGGSYTVQQDELTSHKGLRSTGNSPLAKIIQKYKHVWEVKKEQLIQNIKNHQLKERNKFLLKKRVLSYEFHSQIFGGNLEWIQEQQNVVNFLQTEENIKLRTIKLDELYIKMDMVRFGEFEPLLYFFFDDLWKNNQDIAIIKKNAQILNPESSKCLIYQRNSTIEAWKAEFIIQMLRTNNGGGFFHDKLLYALQRKLKNCQDKWNYFITEESLL